MKCRRCGTEIRRRTAKEMPLCEWESVRNMKPSEYPFEESCQCGRREDWQMKAVDDTPAQTRTFEVTIPCPHCRRLLDVFLKEAS